MRVIGLAIYIVLIFLVTAFAIAVGLLSYKRTK